MMPADSTSASLRAPGPLAARTVEGIARVVRVEGGTAWLEPEQTTSCGHCASAGACGIGAPEPTGIGTVTRRIEARRFTLDDADGPHALKAGDRIVVGVDQRALVKAALVAYALPLAAALAAGGIAQAIRGEDFTTLLCMAGGLAVGLLAARFAARRLATRGELAPRFLRRARPGETSASTGETP